MRYCIQGRSLGSTTGVVAPGPTLWGSPTANGPGEKHSTHPPKSPTPHPRSAIMNGPRGAPLPTSHCFARRVAPRQLGMALTVCMYVCMYVCIYIYIYIGMALTVYIYIYIYIYISGGPLSALTCCVNVRLLSGDKKNISKLGWELGLYYASYDDFHLDILARMYT